MAKARLPRWAPPPHLSCFSCKSAGHTEWCVLGAEQLNNIDQAKVPRRYKPGDTIYGQGEDCSGIYCVEQGTVAVRSTQADGNSRILRVAESGKTLGYSDYFGGAGYRSSAVALTEATVCHIPAEAIRQVLGHNPVLGLSFLARGAEDLAHADTMNVQQALQSVRMRIVHLLLSLRDKHGMANADGSIVISLPMSWQDAAELVGARPETVSRTIQALVEDGVIQVSGHVVTISDLDLLLDEIETTQA